MPEKSTSIPREFFSISSFGTLSGSAIITWVVAGVCTGILGKFMRVEPAIVGLIVAMLVSFAGTFLTYKDSKPKNYLIAFFNGFLIYVTAVGMTSFTPYLTASSPKPETEPSKLESAAPVKTAENPQAVKIDNSVKPEEDKAKQKELDQRVKAAYDLIASGKQELNATGNPQLLTQNRERAVAILGQVGVNIEEAGKTTGGGGAAAAALPAEKNFTDAFTKPWIAKQ